jgi:hypothetical protein
VPQRSGSANLDCAEVRGNVKKNSPKRIGGRAPETQTSIAKFNTVIANVSQQHPCWKLVHSLPGAGQGMAPALICCLGKWRPLPECGGVQCDSGIAPVTVATGRTRIIQSVEPVRNFYAKHFMNGRSIQ